MFFRRKLSWALLRVKACRDVPSMEIGVTMVELRPSSVFMSVHCWYGRMMGHFSILYPEGHLVSNCLSSSESFEILFSFCLPRYMWNLKWSPDQPLRCWVSSPGSLQALYYRWHAGQMFVLKWVIQETPFLSQCLSILQVKLGPDIQILYLDLRRSSLLSF